MCMAGLGLLGAGLNLVGSMMGAAGAAAEGRKAKEIATANATRQREAGRYQAKQIRKKVEYINARAKTQTAGRGLELSGSALDVMADSAVQGEIDATNAIKTANQEARVSELQGEAAQLRASNKATSMIIGGFSGFLRMAG